MHSLSNALLLTTALSIALAGCDKPQPATPRTEAPPATKATASDDKPPAAAPATQRDVFTASPQIVATVGEQTITVDDLRAVLERDGRETAGLNRKRLSVRATLDEMIDVALLAETARAEGLSDNAEVRHEADRAVARMLIETKLVPEANEAVTDADIDGYFAERRRAGRLVVDSEEQARAMATTIREAIAANPQAAPKVFADFRAKQGRKERVDAARGARLFFRADGSDGTGRAVVPPEIAAAAFALTAPHEVSDPSKLGNAWALVQLLEVRPAVAPADRDATAIDKARDAIAKARLESARRDFIARLRRDATISIDEAKVGEITRAARARAHQGKRKLPFDIKKWRKNQLRGTKQRPLPGVGAERKDLRNSPEEIMQKMRPKPAEETRP